ncbi:hypothetical protein [Fusicatenibacter sp.]
MKHGFRAWYLGITIIFALLVFSTATYAWFTSNRKVSTGRATARTGNETLELQISSSGGGSFRSEETIAVTQVNQTDVSELMPVSTADLVNFVTVPSTENGMATIFKKVDNEAYYYHGRLYLRALGEGWDSTSRMALYLDQSDGVLGENISGQLLHAARLGMVFDDDSQSYVILRLSEDENAKSQQNYNTVINGRTLGKNEVLTWKKEAAEPVQDPSVSVESYTIRFQGNSMTLPDKALLTMEFNRIYPVDIYFYLEGCDPDCSDALSFDVAELYLAFYGVLQEGAG